MESPFANRAEAGRVLAGYLTAYANREDVVILALPRGGVPVGVPVAKKLNAPLDVFVVRKLGVPGHEELAMGAITSGGLRVLNSDIIEGLCIPAEAIECATAREQQELQRRELAKRDGRPGRVLVHRIVSLIDDGLASGKTMRAAAAAVRQRQPRRLIIAVPTAAPETCRSIHDDADEVICAITPDPFHAVGLWYRDFNQTTDEEVRALLSAANAPRLNAAPVLQTTPGDSS
jgi:predicted phosphoribosyltransferase